MVAAAERPAEVWAGRRRGRAPRAAIPRDVGAIGDHDVVGLGRGVKVLGPPGDAVAVRGVQKALRRLIRDQVRVALQLLERAVEHVHVDVSADARDASAGGVLVKGPVAPRIRGARAVGAVPGDVEGEGREVGALDARVPEVGAGVDEGRLASALRDGVEPGVNLRRDGRCGLAAGGLNVQHHREIPGAQVTHFGDDDVRLLRRIQARLKELVGAPKEARGLDAAPVGREIGVSPGPIPNPRDGELLPGRLHRRPVDGALVDGNIDAGDGGPAWALGAAHRLAHVGRASHLVGVERAGATRGGQGEKTQREDSGAGGHARKIEAIRVPERTSLISLRV